MSYQLGLQVRIKNELESDPNLYLLLEKLVLLEFFWLYNRGITLSVLVSLCKISFYICPWNRRISVELMLPQCNFVLEN